jgi:hypothetical protein
VTDPFAEVSGCLRGGSAIRGRESRFLGGGDGDVRGYWCCLHLFFVISNEIDIPTAACSNNEISLLLLLLLLYLLLLYLPTRRRESTRSIFSHKLALHWWCEGIQAILTPIGLNLRNKLLLVGDVTSRKAITSSDAGTRRRAERLRYNRRRKSTISSEASLDGRL